MADETEPPDPDGERHERDAIAHAVAPLATFVPSPMDDVRPLSARAEMVWLDELVDDPPLPSLTEQEFRNALQATWPSYPREPVPLVERDRVNFPHDWDDRRNVCVRCGWEKREVLAYRKNIPCKIPPYRTKLARAMYRLGWDVVDVHARSFGPGMSMVPRNRNRPNVRHTGRIGDWLPTLLPERVVGDLIVSVVADRVPGPRNDTIDGLLETIAGGELGRAPIVADALEDFGCVDSLLLAALRVA